MSLMRFLCPLVALFFAFSPVSAAPETSLNLLPARLGDTLDHYAQMKGFRCTFTQSLIFSDDTMQTFEGDLTILRPQKFYWQYTRPYVQAFIGNAEKIWHYEPDLFQVRVIHDLDQLDPVVMQLLSGGVDKGDIQVLEILDVRHYRLKLKGRIELDMVIAENGLIEFIETTDVLGHRNRLTFDLWDFQTPDPTLFDFKPPAGVDIVGG